MRRASTANGGANDGWCVCLFFGPPLLFVRTALHESRRRRSPCHAPAWIFWRRRQFGWKGRVVADLCLTIGLVDAFGGCYVGRRMVLWPQNSFIFTLGFHSFHVDASRNLNMNSATNLKQIYACLTYGYFFSCFVGKMRIENKRTIDHFTWARVTSLQLLVTQRRYCCH